MERVSWAKGSHNATYDETSHRTGPRKKKIPHIAGARTATGRLTEEIKIGPQMIGMIENSANDSHGRQRQRQDTTTAEI